MSKKIQVKPKPQQLRVGDRYQDNDHHDVWEYTSDNSSNIFPHNAICIDVGRLDELLMGDIDNWNFTDDYWNYLGNFSKQDNFIELYNLLNESTE